MGRKKIETKTKDYVDYTFTTNSLPPAATKESVQRFEPLKSGWFWLLVGALLACVYIGVVSPVGSTNNETVEFKQTQDELIKTYFKWDNVTKTLTIPEDAPEFWLYMVHGGQTYAITTKQAHEMIEMLKSTMEGSGPVIGGSGGGLKLFGTK